jgi:glycosyltransferase involved in cell wall biosynthesis
VLVHPAPGEPFGMTMLEAFAHQLPVVAAPSSELAPLFRSHDAATLPESESRRPTPGRSLPCWTTGS